MRHKFILILLSIFLFTLMTSLSANDKNIRYITGYISNVDGNKIVLNNNLIFRANEHVTAVSMTPVTIVLEYDRPEGFVYLKNRKVDVVLMKNSGGGFLVPAMKADISIYNEGTLHQIKELVPGKKTIILSDNTKLFLTDKSEKEEINKWETGDWVILPDLPASSSPLIINTRTNDKVKVSKELNAQSVN